MQTTAAHRWTAAIFVLFRWIYRFLLIIGISFIILFMTVKVCKIEENTPTLCSPHYVASCLAEKKTFSLEATLYQQI